MRHGLSRFLWKLNGTFPVSSEQGTTAQQPSRAEPAIEFGGGMYVAGDA
jgi:hypothetical protein